MKKEKNPKHVIESFFIFFTNTEEVMGNDKDKTQFFVHVSPNIQGLVWFPKKKLFSAYNAENTV